MTVTLNGREHTVLIGTTLAEIVASMGHDPARPGVAVAIDGEIVRRTEWGQTLLAGGEVVEVVTAVQGGA